MIAEKHDCLNRSMGNIFNNNGGGNNNGENRGFEFDGVADKIDFEFDLDKDGRHSDCGLGIANR